MKFMVDVCLAREVAVVVGRSTESCMHWSEIGPDDAKDQVIMEWCRVNGLVLITADQDFGTLLKYSGETSPSVIILRTGDHAPASVIPLVLEAILRFKEELEQGCLIALNERSARLRRLPIA